MSPSAPALHPSPLPRPAPARVLALGAYLKNSACLIEGDRVWWSPVHGDLGSPEAIAALQTSVAQLQAVASGPIDALAHDLHPDFFSTQLAHQLAQHLSLPAIGVQHHHAHIAVVQAEQAVDGPVIGLALDGVGLGTDGTSWGGELLWVDEAAQAQRWQRLDHLPALALPGGDVAAREPWRMAAAALHAVGRAEQIVPRFGPQVGEGAARLLAQMLARGLNCPPSTGAGRWFDAVAGLLGLSLKQSAEAEAAMALEQRAAEWLAAQPGLAMPWPSMDLLPWVSELLGLCPPGLSGEPLRQAQGRGAALFHLALASGLAQAAGQAARRHGAATVVLGGGCFFNRLLSQQLSQALTDAGLRVARPASLSCGDAGLALGQAWVAACHWRAEGRALPPGAAAWSVLPVTSTKD